MRTVILAGGWGSRLSEETVSKLKPMVEIGGDPILWHILKHYAHYGHNEFIVALGYRGGVVEQYFAQYAALAAQSRSARVGGSSPVQPGTSRTGRSTWWIRVSTPGPAAGCAGSRDLLEAPS